ncbi:GNAT family N-acetyltransferase [Garicola koreensis]|uniref:N-acetyltransferase domain-containing protein n=1 Tax=Garicola koreensis TaxID=1262554 RepID=A0A7W5TPW0_9MICC|nr:hypothetical protein [Garicola koreensis]
MPLWSPSARASPHNQVARATDGAVRVLSGDDTAALHALLATDPIAHVSVTATVRQRGTAAPGRGRNAALVLGTDRPGSAELASACWVGSNIIPVAADAAEGELFGFGLRALRRRVSSIYGRSEPVLAMFEATGWSHCREVRQGQPLMHTDAPSGDVEPLAGLRHSRMEEFDAVERACAAMFTEELGFSPYEQGASLYRERIRGLIRAGHSLISVDPQSRQIVFKAEFGAVTNEVVQVQGVWVDPRWRGQGIAAPGMAAVIDYGLRLAPQVSLYVNSYNTAAIRAYERVGFQHCGTYTTVLF